VREKQKRNRSKDKMAPITLRLLAHQALLGFATLTSALAILPPDTSANPAAVAKRAVTYHTYTDSTVNSNDYCGEANPNTSTSQNSPLAADCTAIADAYTENTGNGVLGSPKAYWTVDLPDFVSSPDGFVTLATSGTCRFRIKYYEQVLNTVYFGANDLRFYMRQALQSVDAQGRVEARGAVSCYANAPGKFATIEWWVARV